MLREIVAATLIAVPGVSTAELDACDAAQWNSWADLIERYKGEPEEVETMRLYLLNQRLCADVQGGRMAEPEAAALYEDARKAWLDYMRRMIRIRDERSQRRDAA